MTTTPPEIAGFPAGMPQEYGRRQQVPTGRSKKTNWAKKKKMFVKSPKCILRAVLWVCEGTLGGKQGHHGRGPESAEV